MIVLPEFIQPLFEFLNVILVDKPYLFLSIWSIIHFFAGLFIYVLARELGEKNPFLLTTLCLIIFEMFEFILWGILLWITPESTIDWISDIGIGVLGIGLGWLILRLSK